MRRQKIIAEATRLVSTDREKSYGNKRKNHLNIAKLWSAYLDKDCLLYTSPSPRDRTRSRMPSSA